MTCFAVCVSAEVTVRDHRVRSNKCFLQNLALFCGVTSVHLSAGERGLPASPCTSVPSAPLYALWGP